MLPSGSKGSFVQPACLERGRVQAQQSVSEPRHVVEEGPDRSVSGPTGGAVDPRVQQRVPLAKAVQDEVGRVPGHAQVLVPTQSGARFAEGADGERVPGDDHLFVPEGMFALGARREQSLPAALEQRPKLRLRGPLRGRDGGGFVG